MRNLLPLATIVVGLVVLCAGLWLSFGSGPALVVAGMAVVVAGVLLLDVGQRSRR